MSVVLADVDPDALASAQGELGAEVLTVPTDVSDAGQVEALAGATFERFGTAHIVCLNAGVAAGGVSWELPEKTWRWVLDVNLWGVVHGIRAFVPRLVEQADGHVLLTARAGGAGPEDARRRSRRHRGNLKITSRSRPVAPIGQRAVQQRPEGGADLRGRGISAAHASHPIW